MLEMEQSVTEVYKEYYYPVILLSGDLKVTYKNETAQAAKMKPRMGVHIRNYMNEENLKILEHIGAARQVVELNDCRCIARLHGGMVALVFFDSLNFIRDCDAETAARINELAAEYDEQESQCINNGAEKRDNNRIRKVRGYFSRHIANIKMDREKTGFEKSYCDIWEFLHNFEQGVLPCITNLGYTVTFATESLNRMFIHKLNESDFLTLNFIFMSYALSKSVFGVVDIKFEAGTGAVIYEFLPCSGFVFEKGMDLRLAELIAKNNDLRLEFRRSDDAGDITRGAVEGKVQIRVRFMTSAEFSQSLAGDNIMNIADIAERAQIELAFLNNFENKFV